MRNIRFHNSSSKLIRFQSEVTIAATTSKFNQLGIIIVKADIAVVEKASKVRKVNGWNPSNTYSIFFALLPPGFPG